MIKHGKTLLLAALLLPGAALAQFSVGDDIGTTETEVRAALEAQGYVVSEIEIEIEDGNIEADAVKAGQSFEIEVSTETGLVLAFYEDDDDGMDDDDEGDNDD
ncbi:PepSY domain-containing protein [Roseovarius sp. EL26]|uniref:PepSY domain-containing protein n=1 Tax=Roseovarius sp. EL26 TaxID=2126672 RepID=UPI000EA30692|nr:PepSY domain-containing protein [Roseovarius sp. EL26]